MDGRTEAEPIPLSPRSGIVTNWATFYHQIEVDGFSHQFHIPIRNFKAPRYLDVEPYVETDDVE